jgi:hypothetical protein
LFFHGKKLMKKNSATHRRLWLTSTAAAGLCGDSPNDQADKSCSALSSFLTAPSFVVRQSAMIANGHIILVVDCSRQRKTIDLSLPLNTLHHRP